VVNIVQAPQAQPPRLGLLVSAFTPTEPLDRVEALGYQAEACGGYRLVDPCSDTEINRGYPLGAPAYADPAITTATTGGTLAAGTYSYKVTAVDANGESTPTAAVSITTTGATSTVTVDWLAVNGATSYKVYGRTGGSWGLLATVTAPTTVYIDTGADTPGAAPPQSDTTGDPNRQTLYEPFAVEAEDHCSAFGFQAHDYEGRAIRRLRAVESAAIARELWTGELAAAAGNTGNRRLASTTTTDNLTSGGAVAAVRALALLEDGIAQCMDGGRAMIHVTRGGAAVLAHGGGLRREGNLLLTANDSVVVPDAGYPGTAPDGTAPAAGETWAYATPMVTVRRSKPTVIPGSLAEAIDKNLNTIAYKAEELAAVTFDCCAFAARLTIA
jgi:hypothetical protein